MQIRNYKSTKHILIYVGRIMRRNVQNVNPLKRNIIVGFEYSAGLALACSSNLLGHFSICGKAVEKNGIFFWKLRQEAFFCQKTLNICCLEVQQQKIVKYENIVLKMSGKMKEEKEAYSAQRKLHLSFGYKGFSNMVVRYSLEQEQTIWPHLKFHSEKLPGTPAIDNLQKIAFFEIAEEWYNGF